MEAGTAMRSIERDERRTCGEFLAVWRGLFGAAAIWDRCVPPEDLARIGRKPKKKMFSQQ